MDVDQGLLHPTFDGEKEKGERELVNGPGQTVRVAYGPCWNKPMAELNKEWDGVSWQGLLGLPADLLFARSYTRPRKSVSAVQYGAPFRESLGGQRCFFQQ